MSERTIRSADEILTVDELPRELVDTTRWWGAKVWVRGMTAYERVEWASKSSAGDPLSGCHLAALTMVDEEGEPLFPDHDPQKLANLNGEPIALVVQTALRLSGLGGNEQGKAD
jgi:hypothetical protein